MATSVAPCHKARRPTSGPCNLCIAFVQGIPQHSAIEAGGAGPGTVLSPRGSDAYQQPLLNGPSPFVQHQQQQQQRQADQQRAGYGGMGAQQLPKQQQQVSQQLRPGSYGAAPGEPPPNHSFARPAAQELSSPATSTPAPQLHLQQQQQYRQQQQHQQQQGHAQQQQGFGQHQQGLQQPQQQLSYHQLSYQQREPQPLYGHQQSGVGQLLHRQHSRQHSAADDAASGGSDSAGDRDMSGGDHQMLEEDDLSDDVGLIDAEVLEMLLNGDD